MDISSIIKTVAPWIGTALGGPLGGMAVEAACSALGITEKTSEGLKLAISGATPEQMLALKKADQDFAKQMQVLGFQQEKDLEAISAGDRKDARSLLVNIRSWVPAALSILVTIGFFSMLVGMMLGKFKVEDSQALLMLLGSLSSAWVSVMAFWFGTTSSSGQKTELLAKAPPV